MDRVAETRTAEVFVREGCVVARIRERLVQTLADAKENLQTTVDARGGRRCPLLIDISRCEPLAPEVRHYYTGEKLVEAFSALGLVVTASPFGRMMGNVYLRIARPGIPTRLFTSTEEAIRWTTTL